MEPPNEYKFGVDSNLMKIMMWLANMSRNELKDACREIFIEHCLTWAAWKESLTNFSRHGRRLRINDVNWTKSRRIGLKFLQPGAAMMVIIDGLHTQLIRHRNTRFCYLQGRTSPSNRINSDGNHLDLIIASNFEANRSTVEGIRHTRHCTVR